MDIGIHFSWVNTQMWNGWSYCRWLLNFKNKTKQNKTIATCQTVFPKWLYYFTFSAAVCENPSFCMSLPALGMLSLTNFSYSNSYIVASSCSFNFHFPDGQWCWTSFYVLICHLYIFLGGVSVQIFGQFLVNLFLLLGFENSYKSEYKPFVR